MSVTVQLKNRFPAPLSVLVVDDYLDIREIVEHWLSREGCAVIRAGSGREANRLAESHRFDLVITDVLMPDGDGLEVIAGLRRMQPAARLLAMSGGGSHLGANDCLRLAKSLGAHAVVTKPFTREQLFDAIGAALGVPCPEQGQNLPSQIG
jgi:CheY-like chemotaxis protein